MIQPTEYQLIEMYRTWWQASYGVAPNNQAAVIAASFAQHVINTINDLEENHVNP